MKDVFKYTEKHTLDIESILRREGDIVVVTATINGETFETGRYRFGNGLLGSVKILETPYSLDPLKLVGK